jgi:hypothetical protein
MNSGNHFARFEGEKHASHGMMRARCVLSSFVISGCEEARANPPPFSVTFWTICGLCRFFSAGMMMQVFALTLYGYKKRNDF